MALHVGRIGRPVSQTGAADLDASRRENCYQSAGILDSSAEM
jgi:hypothetical protein